MSAYTFDGLDLDTSPYRILRDGSDLYSSPPPRHQVVDDGSRPGGTLALRPPGPQVVTLHGTIEAASATAFESARDTLVTRLMRPRRRLTTRLLADRYLIATLTAPVRVVKWDANNGEWFATFTAEDAYDATTAPAGTVTTVTLSLLPGETVQYGSTLTLTPGGSGAVTPRWLITNQAGGVTPLLWELRNLDNGRALAVPGDVAAGSGLLIDPRTGVYAGSLSSLAGFWPLLDDSGSPTDFSGNGRDLAVSGAPVYRQDGPERFGPAMAFDGVDDFLSSANAAYQITAALTLACWVWIDAITGTHFVIGRGGANQGYALGYTSTGFLYRFGDGAVNSVTGTTAPVAGAWYFIAATHSTAADVSRLYVGTEELPPRLEAVGDGDAITNAANNLRVGSAHDPSGGTARFHDGRIAMPAVYSAALTADQVRRIWQRGPQAYADQQIEWRGRMVDLDPALGATNRVRLRADHGTTAPVVRIGAVWRSRYG